MFAVDDSGGREQLTPTDSGQLTLDGIGGRIRGIDPYWLRLDFTPPAGDVVEYEVDLAVDGEDHAFTVRAEELPREAADTLQTAHLGPGEQASTDFTLRYDRPCGEFLARISYQPTLDEEETSFVEAPFDVGNEECLAER